jgi:hypothetical protein
MEFNVRIFVCSLRRNLLDKFIYGTSNRFKPKSFGMYFGRIDGQFDGSLYTKQKQKKTLSSHYRAIFCKIMYHIYCIIKIYRLKVMEVLRK